MKQLIGEVGLENSVAEEVVRTREMTLEQVAGLEGGEELIRLFTLAQDYGISEWLQFDPTVVRGLAYYTGVVWEVFVRTSDSDPPVVVVDGGEGAPVKFRAVSGGGRYDKLFSLYGSPVPVPCVGFGFGDCVIIELLKDRGLIPAAQPKVDFLVGAMKGFQGAALQVARGLRASGASVDVMMKETAPRKIFTHADKVGARMVAMVAGNEWEKGLVTIKDIRSGSQENRRQENVPVSELGNWAKYFE